MPPFEDLYEPCVSCRAPCNDVLNANTDPRVDDRYIPRGFYSDAQPGEPVLMFLAMNPGGGRGGLLEPPGYYAVNHPRHVLDVHRAFLDEQFNRPRRGFHRKLKLQVSAFLNVPTQVAMRFAVFTELFKCTTPGDGMASPQTVDRCVELHLTREIREWQPLAVIPLGEAVRNWIAEHPAVFHGIPVIRLMHPSYYGRSDEEFRQEAVSAFERLPVDTQIRIRHILADAEHEE